MNLRLKLTAGAATIALIGGLSLATQVATAADTAAPSAKPAATTGTPVTDVQNHETLVGAKVKDNKGEAVGEVKSVKIDAAGKIAAVNVTVGAKTIALNAESLSYAQADNTLVSSQSKADIQKLPPAM